MAKSYGGQITPQKSPILHKSHTVHHRTGAHNTSIFAFLSSDMIFFRPDLMSAGLFFDSTTMCSPPRAMTTCISGATWGWSPG